MRDYPSCPSCGSECLDPWHYERQFEPDPDDDPCGCVPVKRAS